MVILFLVLPFQKLQIFSFTFAAPFISLTLLSRLIDLCSVLSFALFFPISPLTLFSMIYCARFGLNVLFLPLGFLHGICCGSSHSFGFLPLNFFPLAPCGISPARSFSLSRLLLLAVLRSFRLSLLLSLFQGVISSSPIFQNSGPSPNPLPTLFRGIFVSTHYVILWATCRMSCYFVLCGL